MKLAALLCVALFSVGCATDDDVNNGGFAVVRPAKSSIIPNTQNGEVPPVSGDIKKDGMWKQDPLLHGSDLSAETILDGHAPLPNEVCGGCQVTLITISTNPVDDGSVGRIEVVNDGGDHICTIVTSAGVQDASDCVR